MMPERRDEIIALEMKSILSRTLATCMTGAVIGILWFPGPMLERTATRRARVPEISRQWPRNAPPGVSGRQLRPRGIGETPLPLGLGFPRRPGIARCGTAGTDRNTTS
jgi:hypothetical protein